MSSSSEAPTCLSAGFFGERRPHRVPLGLDLGGVGAELVGLVVLGDPGHQRAMPVVEGVVLREVVVVPDAAWGPRSSPGPAGAPASGRAWRRPRRGRCRTSSRSSSSSGRRAPRGSRPCPARRSSVLMYGRTSAYFAPQASAKDLGARRGWPSRSRRCAARSPGRTGLKWPGVQFSAGCARAHPARVEADDVVLGRHRLRQRRGDESGEVSPLPPGPPGLTSSGPWYFFAVCGTRDSARVICRPRGLGVVERHLQRRALERRGGRRWRTSSRRASPRSGGRGAVRRRSRRRGRP